MNQAEALRVARLLCRNGIGKSTNLTVKQAAWMRGAALGFMNPLNYIYLIPNEEGVIEFRFWLWPNHAGVIVREA